MQHYQSQCEEALREVEFLSRKILDLNKKLIESEKAKSKFLSLVASELNNPMTTLLGMIPKLEPLPDSTKHTIYDFVYDQALHLHCLIENVVAAAEIESGESDLCYADTHLIQIVDDLGRDIRYRMKEKNLLMIVDNEIEGSIVTDPKKINLILKNMIMNACQYAHKDSEIKVHLSKRKDYFSIIVENVGDAPHVTYTAELFNRFSEGPDGLHGLGLGLSIIRNYVELLGGGIDYESIGNKIIFTAHFPFSTEQSNSCAIGSDEFLFESFGDSIEM